MSASSVVGLDPIEEADLRWALCWAEGELGLQSNYSAAVACLELGVPFIEGKPSTEMNEKKLMAAERERKVRRQLEGIRGEDRLVLMAMFGPVVCQKMALWGRLTPLAPLTPTAQRMGGDDTRLWLLTLHWEATRPDGAGARAVAKRIAAEAEQLLAHACRVYHREGK